MTSEEPCVRGMNITLDQVHCALTRQRTQATHQASAINGWAFHPVENLHDTISAFI